VALVDMLHELRNPGRAWHSLGTARGLLLVFIVLYVAGITAYVMVDPIYDRYLWPLSAPMACLLLLVPGRAPADPERAPPAADRYMRRAGMGAAAGLMSMLAVISLMVVLNAFAYDAAGWRMGSWRSPRAMKCRQSTPGWHGPATTPKARLTWACPATPRCRGTRTRGLRSICVPSCRARPSAWPASS